YQTAESQFEHGKPHTDPSFNIELMKKFIVACAGVRITIFFVSAVGIASHACRAWMFVQSVSTTLDASVHYFVTARPVDALYRGTTSSAGSTVLAARVSGGSIPLTPN